MSRITPIDRTRMVKLHMQHLNSAITHLAALGPEDGLAVCAAILHRDRNPYVEDTLGSWMDSLEELRPRLVLKVAHRPTPLEPASLPSPSSDNPTPTPAPAAPSAPIAEETKADDSFTFTSSSTTTSEAAADPFAFNAPASSEDTTPKVKAEDDTKSQASPQPYASIKLPAPPLQQPFLAQEQLDSMWKAHAAHAPQGFEFINFVPPYDPFNIPKDPWAGVIKFSPPQL